MRRISNLYLQIGKLKGTIRTRPKEE